MTRAPIVLVTASLGLLLLGAAALPARAQVGRPGQPYEAVGAAAAVRASSLQRGANLADLTDPVGARASLGLGALATQSQLTAAQIVAGLNFTPMSTAGGAFSGPISTPLLQAYGASYPLVSLTGTGNGPGLKTTRIYEDMQGDAVFDFINDAGTIASSYLTATRASGVVNAPGGLQSGGVRVARVYWQTLGDGASTRFTVNHNLGTQHVTYQVHETAAPYGFDAASCTDDSANSLTCTFEVAPAAGSLEIVVTG